MTPSLLETPPFLFERLPEVNDRVAYSKIIFPPITIMNSGFTMHLRATRSRQSLERHHPSKEGASSGCSKAGLTWATRFMCLKGLRKHNLQKVHQNISRGFWQRESGKERASWYSRKTEDFVVRNTWVWFPNYKWWNQFSKLQPAFASYICIQMNG